MPRSPNWGWTPVTEMGLGPHTQNGTGPQLLKWGWAPVTSRKAPGAKMEPWYPEWGWALVAETGPWVWCGVVWCGVV